MIELGVSWREIRPPCDEYDIRAIKALLEKCPNAGKILPTGEALEKNLGDMTLAALLGANAPLSAPLFVSTYRNTWYMTRSTVLLFLYNEAHIRLIRQEVMRLLGECTLSDRKLFDLFYGCTGHAFYDVFFRTFKLFGKYVKTGDLETDMFVAGTLLFGKPCYDLIPLTGRFADFTFADKPLLTLTADQEEVREAVHSPGVMWLTNQELQFMSNLILPKRT